MFKIGDKFYNTKTKGYGTIVEAMPHETLITDEVTGTEYLYRTKAYHIRNIFNNLSHSWLLEETIKHYLNDKTLEFIKDFKPLKAMNKFVF